MLDLNYNALLLKAQRSLQNKDVLLAYRICQDLLKQKKNDPNLLALMARVAIEQARNDDAVKLLEKCIAMQPKAVGHHVELGRLLSQMGRSTPAIARLEKARRLAPSDPRISALLADVQERAGEKQKARELLEPFITSATHDPFMAAVWARMALNDKNPDEALRVLTPHLNGQWHPGDFWFVVGQTFEKIGELEKAFDAYCTANAKPTHRFDITQMVQEYDQLIRTFTKDTLARIPKPLHDTSKPIFIAGRPRSGTTLVEKILDSHPHVEGVGELPHLPPVLENLGFEIGSILQYPKAIADLDQDDVNRLSKDYLEKVRRLAPGARHTVDKNLSNYQMVGIMQVLFPQSHVIHIRREPVDNCWAIFVADMNYAWCGDLRTLGITHALYERIMRHWHEALDLPILDVDYESLVEDQEGWTRKLLEFCGLPWDDRCMRYYEEASKKKDSASAPTLSYNQVRQPIYKTSVGRAQKFEPYLGPLREALEEGRKIADELGK